MPAAVASFVVPALADDEVIIVRVPAAQRRDPGFAQRLGSFLAEDAAPSARLRRRNDLIRELATRYTGDRKARAVALLADANRYAATAWRRHRQLTRCPAELLGTDRELLWLLFKQNDHIPTSWRQIWNIIGPSQPPAPVEKISA
jgi:hypothetical protein